MTRKKPYYFIKFSFLIGFIWGVLGFLACLDGYSVDEDELVPAFLPAFILMLPAFYFFIRSNTFLELTPGFIGIYFQRKRLEEEAKVKELKKNFAVIVTNEEVVEEEELKGFSRLPYILTLLMVSFTVAMLDRYTTLYPFTGTVSLLYLLPIYMILYWRLRNIGYKIPSLISLLGFIPLINLVIAYQCLIYPKNYAHTNQLDRTGKVLRVVYFSMLLLIILAFIIAVLASVFT